MSLMSVIGGVLGQLRGELGSFGDLEFKVQTNNWIDTLFGKGTTEKYDKFGLVDTFLGDIVGRSKVLTFDNFERQTQGRYATHDLINQPAMIEHLGTDVEKISMDILLMTALGVNVQEETEKIHEYLKDGYADFLIIGSEIVGDTQWVISDLREKKIVVDGYGRTTVAQLELEFTSYAEPVDAS